MARFGKFAAGHQTREIERDVLAVAAHIGVDFGDDQRQQLGQQTDFDTFGGSAEMAHQQVVNARLG